VRLLWMIWLAAGTAAADDAIDVRVRPSATTVAVGQRFQIDVVVTVAGQEQIDDISMPDLSAFELDQEHETQGVNMAVVNGRRTVTVTHTTSLMVRATTPGKKIIAGAAASLGTSSARAAPVSITVTGTAAAAAPSPTPTPSMDDNDDVIDPNLPAQAGKEAMFLHTYAEPSSPVVGEEITVVTELWSTRRLTSLPQKISHKPAGFYCVPSDDRSRRLVTVGAVRYEAAVIARDALFGLAAGTYKLEPLRLQVDTQGFGKRATNLVSNTIVIEVQPLPADAAGSVVGDYQWEQQLSVDSVVVGSGKTASVRVGEPVVLRTVLRGQGNIDNLELPAAVVEGARVFPAQQQRNRSNESGPLTGVVIQDQLITPTTAGTLTIPAMTLRTYVPAEKAVRVLRSEVRRVRVVGADKAAAVTTTTAAIQMPWPHRQRGDEVLSWLRRHGWVWQAMAGWLVVVAVWPKRSRTAVVTDLKSRARAAAAAGDAATLVVVVHEAFAAASGMSSAGLSAVELEQRFAHVPTAKRVAAFVRTVEAAQYSPTQRTVGLSEGVALVDHLSSGQRESR
jgi:hypothetical protein